MTISMEFYLTHWKQVASSEIGVNGGNSTYLNWCLQKFGKMSYFTLNWEYL